MAVYCPAKEGPALYLDCRECDDKICEKFCLLVTGDITDCEYKVFQRKLDRLCQNLTDYAIMCSGTKLLHTMSRRYAAEKGILYGEIADAKDCEALQHYIGQYQSRGCVFFGNDMSEVAMENMRYAKCFRTPFRFVKMVKKG